MTLKENRFFLYNIFWLWFSMNQVISTPLQLDPPPFLFHTFSVSHTDILKRQNNNKKIRIEQSKLARKEMKEKAGEPQIDTESHRFSNTEILLKHKTESLFELKDTEKEEIYTWWYKPR